MSSTEDFWNSLGGRKCYQTSPLLETQAEDHPPRLYTCSNKTGRFIVSVWGGLSRVGCPTLRCSGSQFSRPCKPQVILCTPHMVAFRVSGVMDMKAQGYWNVPYTPSSSEILIYQLPRTGAGTHVDGFAN